MKKRILLVLTLLLSTAGAQPQHNKPRSTAWEFYSLSGEEFSFALPNHPSMRTSNEKRQKPEKDRRIRVLGHSEIDVTYTIYVVDNPEPRQSLDEFIKQLISNSSDPTANGDVTVNGFTRKEFVYSDKKGMVHFFATENRLCAFKAQGAWLDDSRMTDFFTTISLVKHDKNIEVFDGPGSFYDTHPMDVYRGGGLDGKVRIQAKPEASYTPEAEIQRITGTVILRCVLRSEGTVTNIRVIKGLPAGLTERAMEAARQVKFIPATKHGAAISMWMQLEYRFRL